MLPAVRGEEPVLLIAIARNPSISDAMVTSRPADRQRTGSVALARSDTLDSSQQDASRHDRSAPGNSGPNRHSNRRPIGSDLRRSERTNAGLAVAELLSDYS